MNPIKIIATTAVLAAGLSFSAVAQGTGSQGVFTIYNDTTNNVLIGFYTNDGSGWSTNWMAGSHLKPGEHAEAQFHADTGNCAQTFAASWLGDDNSEVVDDPTDIDICDASNIYLGDNEATYD